MILVNFKTSEIFFDGGPYSIEEVHWSEEQINKLVFI